jgi:hypothetical protein
MGKYRGFSLGKAASSVSRLRKFNVTHDRILARLVTHVSTAVELEAADQEN